ncbi:kinase-like domain-containing protein [Roridomyces roridus]|uniref:Kinase-like domain-containing protein n=1 Tax=Roridomyces roridus TaxID=1738132 RepID=A0AAD7BHW9_9AGAR|nr:kinase-like domain-containing protein [Roridomyces roridus]
MLGVYTVSDIQSIPRRIDCMCLDNMLIYNGISSIQERHPVAAAFIYELVVSPWPLVLWMAFCISENEEKDHLPDFLDFLRSSTHGEVFVWDNEDASYLLGILESHYPESWTIYSTWRPYIFEISLENWSMIHTMTHLTARSRGLGTEASQLDNRLCALCLVLSPNADDWDTDEYLKIFAPLEDETVEESAIRHVAEIMLGEQERADFAFDFDSVDGWSCSILESWLGGSCHDLCYSALLAESETSLLRRVEYLPVVAQCAVSQNLLVYTVTTLLERSATDKELQELYKSTTFWAEKREFDCLLAYPTIVHTLLNFLKRSYNDTEYSFDPHRIAKEVAALLHEDLFVVAVRLVHLFSYPDFRKEFLAFRGSDAQALLDLLQNLLDYEQFLVIRSILFEALTRLSDNSGLHPTCFALLGLQKIGHQVAAGGFGDVWKGVVRGQIVCVKVMRLFQESDVRATVKEFSREALIWRQLVHPNLLPFYGLYHLENRLCIVSPWMENGNVFEHVKRNPPSISRRLSLVRVRWKLVLSSSNSNIQILDVALGINILVTPSHRACIVDFGLSSLADTVVLRFTYSNTGPARGTTRYQAPEVLRAEKQNHYGSDVYAFAHVCYEILTGKAPFFDIKPEAAVMFKILDGSRPERLPSCMGSPVLDNLWNLLQHCWKANWTERPKIEEIVQRLISPLIRATTSVQFETDWNHKFSSRFRRSLQVDPLLPSVNQLEETIFGYKLAEACRICSPTAQNLALLQAANAESFPIEMANDNEPSAGLQRASSYGREDQPPFERTATISPDLFPTMASDNEPTVRLLKRKSSYGEDQPSSKRTATISHDF